jgi:long-chain fatty acid transport protein
MPVATLRTSMIVLAVALLLALASAPSTAGGLYLSEFGTPSMGVSGAGAPAIANDASTAFYNPAGMVRLKGSELMITGGLAFVDARFDPASDTPIDGSKGGNAGGLLPLLGTFLAYDLSEDVKLGFSTISLSAAALGFDDDWVGRYQVQDVNLFTISLLPSVGVRITDSFSVGATVNVLYGQLKETLAAPPPSGTGEVEIDGDDWEIGFGLSALLEVGEGTRLGLVYSSEVEPEFGGDVDVDLDRLGRRIEAGVDAKITLPQFVRFGVYHDLSDTVALVGTIGWEDWSALKNVPISVERGTLKLPRDWDDVWKFAAGVRWRVADDWTLMTGVAYDTSPTDRDKRTADMPVDRQIRVSFGAQYELSESTTIGASFTYADFGDAAIDGSLLKGDFESNSVYMLGVNVSFRF